MPNRIEGKKGTLHLTDSESAMQFVADTQNMSINESASTEGTSVHGQDSQATLSSDVSYEISFDGMFSTDNAGQAEIKIGQTVPWTWYVTEDQTPTAPSYSGNMVISSIERGFPADGRASFSVSGSGDGDLIRTNVW